MNGAVQPPWNSCLRAPSVGWPGGGGGRPLHSQALGSCLVQTWCSSNPWVLTSLHPNWRWCPLNDQNMSIIDRGLKLRRLNSLHSCEFNRSILIPHTGLHQYRTTQKAAGTLAVTTTPPELTCVTNCSFWDGSIWQYKKCESRGWAVRGSEVTGDRLVASCQDGSFPSHQLPFPTIHSPYMCFHVHISSRSLVCITNSESSP